MRVLSAIKRQPGGYRIASNINTTGVHLALYDRRCDAIENQAVVTLMSIDALQNSYQVVDEDPLL